MAASDRHTWQRHTKLDSRGVTTNAAVLDYSYDAGGGDPGGWTTDHVRYTTATGETITNTIGHHDPGPEEHTHTITVTYDPLHPRLARATNYNDKADSPTNAYVGAIFTLLLWAASATAMAVNLTTKPTPTSPR